MSTFPGKYDLHIFKGATFNPVFTWKDETGALINLTGYTARMHMREGVDSAAAFATLTTENGGIALGGSAGTIGLLVSAAATSAIAAAKGVYDLELVSSGGIVTRLLEGMVLLVAEVTR